MTFFLVSQKDGLNIELVETTQNISINTINNKNNK